MLQFGRVLTVITGTLWCLSCCGSIQEQITELSGGTSGAGTGTTSTGGSHGDTAVTETSTVVAGPVWGIPEREVEADVGDNAFAVNPTGTSWDVLTWKVGEVRAISGDRATFDASFIEEVPGTPGSVIVEIPKSLSVTKGDIVFGDVYATGRPARVQRIVEDKLYVSTVWVEENTAIDMTIGKNVIEAPYGLKPMAMVAYPADKGGSMYLGTVAATSPTTVWVISEGGTLKEITKPSIVPIDVRRRYKLHEELFAVWNDNKFYHARVVKVLDSGMQYEVEYMTDLHVQQHSVTVAFWEVTKTITPGETVSYEVDEDGYTPTYYDPQYSRGGRSDGGGRTTTPVTKPKKRGGKLKH